MSDQRNIICNISVTMNGMLHCTGCNTKVHNILRCIFIHQGINNTAYKCISTSHTVKDMEGKQRRVCGVIPGRAYRTPKLNRFGYITLTEKQDTGLGEIPAHEFHYFDSTDCGEDFHAAKPASKRGWDCIHDRGRLMAGFPHLYYYGNPRVPARFLKNALEYKKERRQKKDAEI